MKKIYYLFFAILFWAGVLSSQTDSSFNDFLHTIERAPAENHSEMIVDYIERKGGTPIVEGNLVTFLAKGDSPILIADFNGFIHPRYVKDGSLGDMEQIGSTSWNYKQIELREDAAVNYQYKLGELEILDPLNHDMQIAFGEIHSHLAMPDFQISEETILDHSVPKGRLVKDSIKSEILGHTRTVHFYLPHGYEKKPLPSIYFHDGSFNIREGLVPRILDKLIAEGKIEPVVAVFDDPVIRGKEYRGDEAYLRYLEEELIPLVIKKYNTKQGKEERAIAGFSRGGMSSLYAAHKLPSFGKCGIMSPAILPTPVPDFIEELKAGGHRPNDVFMVGAIYDYIWYPDAQKLIPYFEGGDYNFSYTEIPTGHNIPNWRTQFDEMLISFFGVND